MAVVALTTPEGGEAFLKVINAKFGTQLGPDDIPGMGIRVLKAEREFNRRAGFTNEDDRLPRFYYEEPYPPTTQSLSSVTRSLTVPLISNGNQE